MSKKETRVEDRDLYNFFPTKVFIWTVSRSPKDWRKFVHKDGGMSSIRCHQVFPVKGLEKQCKTSSSCCWTVLNVYLETKTDPGSELRFLNAPLTQVWLLCLQHPEEHFHVQLWNSSQSLVDFCFTLLTFRGNQRRVYNNDMRIWSQAKLIFSSCYPTLKRQTPAGSGLNQELSK